MNDYWKEIENGQRFESMKITPFDHFSRFQIVIVIEY